MTLRLSRPFEELAVSTLPVEVDTLIVGSGYGAAMAALALAMREGRPALRAGDILVLERGNEFVPGDFPKTLSDLPAHLSFQANGSDRTGYADALFDLRVGENVNAIVGSGLGGTSLINAGVAVDPTPETFTDWPRNPSGKPWMEDLAPNIRFVRALLGVKPHPRGMALGKVQALRRLAAAMKEAGLRVDHRLADIAVSFDDGLNAVGVEQKACNDCGNCFVGCNIGAKNTLAMNAWPAAAALGVDIVTGGSVIQVLPSAQGASRPWTVQAQRTTQESLRCTILARRVILAAGTFGSTEILCRSHAAGLAIGNPRALGSRFSLNGDGIVFGFGQANPVGSYAKVPSSIGVHPAADERPGPTIVSVARVAEGAAPGGLLEDATVPQAIARLWGEILSTQAMTHAYVSDTPSAWHQRHAQRDPLTVAPDLMDHHQVLLFMGPDVAAGTLAFESGRLAIHWPPGPSGPANARAAWFDRQLDAAKKGFDGGLHLANPFWKPLPEKFEAVFEGASQFGGTHLCNHPLGGCPMGESAASGVVNARGQVFRGAHDVHDGLYVLDGSILPGSVGVNPFVTISALAHRLALQLDGSTTVPQALPVRATPMPFKPKLGQVVDWPVPPLAFEFKERLFGAGDREQARDILRLLDIDPEDEACENSLILDITIQLPDIDAWLADPSSPLKASLVGRLHPDPGAVIDTVEDELLEELFKADGWVRLFARDDEAPCRITRGFQAFARFVALRGDEIFTSGASGGVGAFFRVAGAHAQWRYLHYAFDGQLNGRALAINGTKRLAYAGAPDRTRRDSANPWVALTSIDLHFSVPGQGKHTGLFRVDLVRMARNLKPLQHTGRAETPQVLGGVMSLGALFVRVMAQTHLWSFAAPDYEQFPSCDDANTARLRVPHEIVYQGEAGRSVFKVEVARPHAQGWRLLRARPKQPGRKPPVLLVHGLAHSSQVFWTDSVDRNLAGQLLHEGHDVWLLDHGLSTGLAENPADPVIEGIGRQVGEAVWHIHRTARREGAPEPRVNIFSHCVGSAATSIAILSGQLDDASGKSIVKSLVMHAVPPWIRPSESNMLRAHLGVFFKDRFFPDQFDPIPYDDKKAGPHTPPVSAGALLLDRFASSLPWTFDEYPSHSRFDRDHQFSRTICNRMTALYGYEWAHGNLDRRTHGVLASLVGPADANAYRNLYFLLSRRRVTTSEGVNEYVTVPAFERHWNFPTLFIHGSHNQVFDPESARLSADYLGRINHDRRDARPRQPVGLQIVPGYGHMDLLFGQWAWCDVFGHVTRFFDHGPSGEVAEPPRTPAVTSLLPVTGPIISRPRFAQGALSVRVWVEANEHQASKTEGVNFFGDGWIPLKAQRVRGRDESVGTNLLKRSHFFIYDVDCRGVSDRVVAIIDADGRIGMFPFRQTDTMPPGTVAEVAEATEVDETSLDVREMAWPKLPWFTRLQQPADGRLSFVVGSCVYPGSWFDHDVSDRIYRRIREEVERAADGIDHLLLAGDQIYADATRSMFDIAQHRERYQESYRRAFNSRHAAWVLRHVPTYMAVDDHEFKDNHAQSILGGNLGTQLPEGDQVAAAEAFNFQMHHEQVPTAQTHALWYAFESRGCRFFVFDTRSERDARRAGELKTISEAQRDGFTAWLATAAASGWPVFVVTGSPLVPVPHDELRHPARARTSDTLRAHPDFVAWLTRQLAGAKLGMRPVWLSGDPHLSSVCEVELRDIGSGDTCRVVSVVSSGMNAPMPFANDVPDDIAWAPGLLKLPGVEVGIADARLLSNSRAHALRVDVRPAGAKWEMTLKVLDAHDGPLPAPHVWHL